MFLNWIIRNIRLIGWIAATLNIVCGLLLLVTGDITAGLIWLVIGLTIAVCNPVTV